MSNSGVNPIEIDGKKYDVDIAMTHTESIFTVNDTETLLRWAALQGENASRWAQSGQEYPAIEAARLAAHCALIVQAREPKCDWCGEPGDLLYSSREINDSDSEADGELEEIHLCELCRNGEA